MSELQLYEIKINDFINKFIFITSNTDEFFLFLLPCDPIKKPKIAHSRIHKKFHISSPCESRYRDNFIAFHTVSGMSLVSFIVEKSVFHIVREKFCGKLSEEREKTFAASLKHGKTFSLSFISLRKRKSQFLLRK
jgi:hypothetical protein